MSKFKQKIFAIFALIFAFELVCPQYSYAVDTTFSPARPENLITIAALPQPIISDQPNNGQFLRLPQSDLRKPVKKRIVIATAYSSTIDQCDGDPFTTANGSKVRDGIVAANGLPFGTRVKIPKMFGDKVFSVEDRMNARYGSGHIDIWFPTREQARRFGVRHVEIEIY